MNFFDKKLLELQPSTIDLTIDGGYKMVSINVSILAEKEIGS